MASSAFSIKTILLGIFLGFSIILICIFYPEISSWFNPAPPPVVEETTPEDQEEPAPHVAEETTPEDQEERAPQVVEETEPEDQEEPAPQIAEETEPEDQEEPAPQIAEETEPEDQEEHAPQIAEETEPEDQEEPAPQISEETEPEDQEEPAPQIAEETEPEIEDESETSEGEAPAYSESMDSQEETTPAPTPLVEGPEPNPRPSYWKEETKWRELLKAPIPQEYVDDYPFAECFKTAAADSRIPLPLALALAKHFSNFKPESLMDNKYGLMHLGWPDPSRSLGIKEKETLIDDPCNNIKIACQYLASLFKKSGGYWTPALAAFRKPGAATFPVRIGKSDLLFSKRVREYANDTLIMPFEKKIMHPFLEFDTRSTAEEIMKTIEEMADVKLWLGQKDFDYMIHIPAASEWEKEEIAAKIHEETGY